MTIFLVVALFIFMFVAGMQHREIERLTAEHERLCKLLQEQKP